MEKIDKDLIKLKTCQGYYVYTDKRSGISDKKIKNLKKEQNKISKIMYQYKQKLRVLYGFTV